MEPKHKINENSKFFDIQNQNNDSIDPKTFNDSSKKNVFLVSNQNNRFKTELVRNNWKTILDVAMKRKTFDNFENERLSYSNNFSSMNSQQHNHDDVYATDKENWVYFFIIISVVVILSIIFCFLVYWFFPQLKPT